MDARLDVLVQDMNICVSDTIDRYGLTEAVSSTRDTVTDKDWLFAIKQATPEQAEAMLAATLEPISQELLGQNGYALTSSLPDEALAWFVDSTLQYGVSQGTLTQDQGQRCPECPEPKINVTEVKRFVEVEKIVEKIIYVEEPYETIVEKIVEVPKEIIKEVIQIVELPKIEYVEEIVEVEKIVYNETIVEVEKIIYIEPNCTYPEPVIQEPVIQEIEEPKRKSKSDRNKENVDTYTYTLYTPAYDYSTYNDYYYDYNDYYYTYTDYFNYYDWYMNFDYTAYYDYHAEEESESDDDHIMGYYNWYYNDYYPEDDVYTYYYYYYNDYYDVDVYTYHYWYEDRYTYYYYDRKHRYY